MRDPKLAHILVENDPLDELNQMPLSKKFYLFRKLVKKRKIVVKIEFTPLSLS